MKMRTARNWFGLYYLLAVVLIGCYLILFAGSSALPLEDDQADAAFQIIVPVFVGQLAVVFKWLSTATAASLNHDDICPLPAWAIILPPLLSSAIFGIAAFALYLSNEEGSFLQVSPEDFASAVTLSVSLLSASTILLMPRIFNE